MKFNVIHYNFATEKMEPYDVVPYFVKCYNDADKKPVTFEEFKDFINKESLYRFWSRCEYEIILSDWPVMRKQEKWDVHRQITMNLNIITQIVMDEIKN